MKTTEEILKEFKEKVQELKNAEFVYESETEVLEFGYQHIMDGEAHTVTDWGNIEKFIKKAITAAKAERDEYWKEKVKEVTRLRMACTCLKPNCEKDGWNSAMESVERKLLSKKAENE